MIYINMDLPKEEDEFVEVLIYGNGHVIQTGESWRCSLDGKCYYESITPERFYQATEIHEPHGRLGDLDAIEKQIDYMANLDWNKQVGVSGGMLAALEVVEDAPTIIPASEEE